MRVMKDGAVICNSGHFNVEIDLGDLKKAGTGADGGARNSWKSGAWTASGSSCWRMAGSSTSRPLRDIPASVMDMSFANQALAAEFVVQQGKTLSKDVHRIPAELDREIARLKLQSMGVTIDTLTPEQQKYLASWDLGT